MKILTKIITFLFFGIVLTNVSALEISESKKTLIEKLMAYTGASQTAKFTMEMVTGTIEHNFGNFKKDVTLETFIPEDQKNKVFEESLLNVLTDYRTSHPVEINAPLKIKDFNYSIFDEMFSEKELDEIIKFYDSPIGQKLLSSLPEINKKQFEFITETIDPLIPALVDKILLNEKEALKAKYPKQK